MRLLPKFHAGALRTPDGAEMPFLRIGEGPIPVLVLPGAGDGLTTAADAAWRLALYYRRRARTHTVLVLSRREPIPQGFTVQQHAEDAVWALGHLGWTRGVVECNSGGGPIGQIIAADHPELVSGLILSSTGHRFVGGDMAPGRACIEHWQRLAEERRWTDLSWSSIEATFTPRLVNRYRLFRPLLRLMRSPKHPERLPRIFEGLLDVDNRPVLPRIHVPTLIVAGEGDPVFPPSIQREMGELIPNSRVVIHPGFKHGNDQENPAYEEEATRFMREVAGHSQESSR